MYSHFKGTKPWRLIVRNNEHIYIWQPQCDHSDYISLSWSSVYANLYFGTYGKRSIKFPILLGSPYSVSGNDKKRVSSYEFNRFESLINLLNHLLFAEIS